MTQWFCVRCGGEIPVERILAYHKTRVCVKCSEAIGGEFRLRVTWGRMNKTSSLKHLLGDVDVKFIRKPIEAIGPR